MKIQSIKTVYFSATGNTKNVVKSIGETIARNMNLSYKEIDFTLPQAEKTVTIDVFGKREEFQTKYFR